SSLPHCYNCNSLDIIPAYKKELNINVCFSCKNTIELINKTKAINEYLLTENDLLNDCRISGVPVILVINKIDLLTNKEKMLEKIVKTTENFDFKAVVPICALNGEGVEALMNEIENEAKDGPHFFDDDSLTDQPEKIIAGEIIREKILINMSEEIPHGVGVSIEKMKDRTNPNTGTDIVDIEAVIMCEKASHKGMIIGKSGSMLKKIASSARVDIEEFLQIKVNLQCWVKVKEDWRNKENIIKSLGFTKD
ncbi:MAG: GTPase Era, partial [Clostridia bacterium]